MKQIIRHLSMLCLSGAVLAGCADTSTDSERAAGSSATEVDSLDAAPAVRLRFVHGSPTAGAFDVYVGAGTAPVFAAVAFGSATPYAPVSPDGLQLVLRTAGAAPTDAPVYTSDVIVAQAGDTITSIAGGVLGSTLATVKFRVKPYTEAFAAAQPGQAVVRFVHDSHGLAPAGFDLGADGTIEVPSVAAFTASDTAGVAVDQAHDAQLAIDTGNPARQLTSFTLPRDVLRQRGGVFLALVGVPSFVPRDPRGLAVLAVGRQTATLIRQNPSVYVLPAIPDSSAIDVFAVGRHIGIVQVASDLGFGVLAPRLQVAPTDHGYELIVTRATTDVAAPGALLAFESTGPLVAGERYLAVASGFAARARSRVRVTVEQDGFDRTVTASGRVRAVAASPDAPAVDVGQFAPGEGTAFTGIAGLEALAYRQASAPEGVQTSSAPLNPGVRATGATAALRFDFGALQATERMFGVVVGAFSPRAGEQPTSFVIVEAPTSGSWSSTVLSPVP